MRVYVPVTPRMLRELVAAGDDGQLVPVSGLGFAVTPALREAYTAGDDEELAEVALREAARASLRLLAAESGDAPAGDLPSGDSPDSDLLDGDLPDGDQRDGDRPLPWRRAVVVAEVDATPRPELDDAVVRLPGPVTLREIVAVHVDGAAAEPAVRAAMAVIDAADLGDEDAELLVGDAEDHDLAWYAAQELPFLFELM